MARAKKSSDPSAKKNSRSKKASVSTSGNGPESVATSATTPSAPAGTLSVEAQIRQRAYELFLERGGYGGSPEQDWLRAEAEVRSRNVA